MLHFLLSLALVFAPAQEGCSNVGWVLALHIGSTKTISEIAEGPAAAWMAKGHVEPNSGITATIDNAIFDETGDLELVLTVDGESERARLYRIVIAGKAYCGWESKPASDGNSYIYANMRKYQDHTHTDVQGMVPNAYDSGQQS